MIFTISRTAIFILITNFLIPAAAVFANTADSCFNAKDKACLEKIYSDIVKSPAPEKTEAIYLHGLLELEGENYEQAKKQFEMGVMFGKHEKSGKALKELINSGKVNLKARDCSFVENPEACLLSLSERQPDQSGVAYYSLARLLVGTEAGRAAEYTIKAAENGHKTSQCLLAYGYAQEKARGPSVMAGFVPKLPRDFEKARKWGEKCGFGPFRGYKKDYFARYLKSTKTHKAFAAYKNKPGYYSEGAATPEIAASIAGEKCSIYYKRKPSDPPCKIVSIDGQWVDYFDAPPLPKHQGSIEDLLTPSARKSYREKYSAKGIPKVFAQGPLGNWSWRSKGPEVPLDEVKRLAIEGCQNSWQYKQFGSACEVIEVNGEWVK